MRLVRKLIAGVVALTAACGGTETPPVMMMSGALTDFSLPDVNPTSPTFNMMVSPRAQLGKVSAWYFGHAT